MNNVYCLHEHYRLEPAEPMRNDCFIPSNFPYFLFCPCCLLFFSFLLTVQISFSLQATTAPLPFAASSHHHFGYNCFGHQTHHRFTSSEELITIALGTKTTTTLLHRKWYFWGLSSIFCLCKIDYLSLSLNLAVYV